MSMIGHKIKELALQLTKIPSVVGTKGEFDAAAYIFDYLSQIPYFRANPHNILIKGIEANPEKEYVMAILQGQQKTSTLLCLGHIDTVGVEDYAEIKEFAYSPELLKDKLKEIKFSEPTASEITSDKWLCGRGILDMKTGIAALMVMCELYATKTDELEANIIFLFVPDEEGDSKGMLSAVYQLSTFKETKGWNYIAAIDTDYTTERYPGDQNRYVYIGTVGKVLPCFFVYGEETHVGEAFNGVDANLLAAEVMRQIDMSADLCDVADGEVTLPPVSLHQRDLKNEYSVQTANSVTQYFNFATHHSSPDEVLAKCKQKARLAFQNVIDQLNREYIKFCRYSKMPYRELPWQVNVLTYDELYKRVKAEMGSELDDKINKLSQQLMTLNLDDREFSLAIVKEVHKYYSDQNSKIIVYLAPPYYPHIYIKGDNQKENRLLNAVDKAINDAKKQYNYSIVKRKFYPYISDLSYCSISKDENVINKLTTNMPAWGKKYNLPIKDIQNISMPVVNIGPYGKDAHKMSERVCLDYSFDAMPLILEKTIANLVFSSR